MNHVPAQRAPRGGVPAAASGRPRRLPVERTSFIGRRRELAELADLLATARLVTITGAGGAGKSRLAQRAAAMESSRFSDGVCYVGIAAVEHAARLPSAVAEAVGMQTGADADAGALVDWLAARALLVVLDDCEHLAAACARLVDQALTVAQQLTLLVTSREPLGVAGEAIWAVAPLEAPRRALRPTVRQALQWDAVRLLVERATEARREFVLDDANVDAIVGIARQLDGLPLALELAAARIAHLTPQEVAARLDDRFRFLTSPQRAATRRHRTLKGALDWSHDLLDPVEQAVLRRAAVFVGGCTIAGAEAVCTGDPVRSGTVLDALASLTSKSLLVADAQGPLTRYRFLETVRQYALERLDEHGETASAKERHARWQLEVLSGAAAAGAATSPGLETAMAAFDDAAAALRWAVGVGEADLALGLAAELWRACEVSGRLTQGRELLAAALAVGGWETRALRSRVLDGAASLALLQGDLAAAERLHAENRALCRAAGETAAEASALQGLGLVALLRGDTHAARVLCDETLVLFAALDDERGIAFSLATSGLVHGAAGEREAAAAVYQDSLERLERLGFVRHAADVLSNLGDLASDRGDLVAARDHYRAAYDRYRRIDDARGTAIALNNLALVAREAGDLDAARRACSDAVDRFRMVGDRQGVAASLHNLANLTTESGDQRGAVALYEDSLAIYRELGDASAARFVGEHLQQLTHAGSATPPGNDVLTAREHQIAELVADGLSNREIANQLFISNRTVETHVSHIRRKLDVTSRTQLVRWILDHRLPGPAPTA